MYLGKEIIKWEKSARKTNLSWSELDLMHSHYMIFKTYHVIKNQPITIKMGADNLLLCQYQLQMKIFNMIPHVSNTRKSAHLFQVWKLLVFNAKDTLNLLTDNRRLMKQWEIRSERFSFDEILEGWSRPQFAAQLAGLKLLLKDKHDHVIDDKNLSSNNGMRAEIFKEIIKNLL